MFRRLTLVCLFMASAWVNAQDVINIEDIRPGMRGKTHTVLKGSEIVELETEILGVMWNYMGPHRHVILGRLIDDRTALSGPVHGMSGSPLYIEGKLAGALALRLMTFEKDGHCGFMPIAQMLDVERRKPEKPAKDFFRISEFNPLQEMENKFAANRRKEFGTQTSLLSLPLTMTGWREEFSQAYEKIIGGFNKIIPIASGSVALENGRTKDFALKPGAPLAVVLASGDISISATGTMTWQKGERVMAFGHAFMNAGNIEVPLASAEILSIVPSFLRPYKIASVGKMKGTLYQDREAAVTGKIGDIPEMASYLIRRKHQNEDRPVIQGGFVKDPKIAPMLIPMILANSLMDGQDLSRESSIRMKGKISFQGLPDLELDALYSGNGMVRMMALFDHLFVMFDLFGTFEKELQVEMLEMNLESIESSKIWHIVDAEFDAPSVKAGEKLKMTVLLENQLRQRKVESYEFVMPEHIKDGMVSVRITGGDLQESYKQRRTNIFHRDLSPSAAIQRLNQHYSASNLHVELLTREAGMASENQQQPGLPYSVLRILTGGDRHKRHLHALNDHVWQEEVRQLDGIVKGVRFKSIQVEL